MTFPLNHHPPLLGPGSSINSFFIQLKSNGGTTIIEESAKEVSLVTSLVTFNAAIDVKTPSQL